MKASQVLSQFINSLQSGSEESSIHIDAENKIVTVEEKTNPSNIASSRIKHKPNVGNNSLISFKPIYFDQAVDSLDRLNISIIIFELEPNGTVYPQYISPNLNKFLHVQSVNEVERSLTWIQNIHQNDLQNLVNPAFERILDSGEPQTVEYRYVVKSEVLWVEAQFIPEKVVGSNKIQIFTILQDRTKQKQEIAQLQNISRLNTAIAKSTPFVVYSYDAIEDSYEFIERSISKILPDSIPAIPTDHKSLISFIHPDDVNKFKNYRDKLLARREEEFYQGGSITIRFKKDIGIWSTVKITETISSSPHFHPIIQGVMEDLTQIESLEHQLFEQTQLDALTKLPNRTMFIKQTSDKLEEFIDGNIHTFSLLFIDVNRFSIINESLGYKSGDILLSKIGERLANIIDEGTYLSRLGVDEFALIVQNFKSENELTQLAIRLINELSKPYDLEGLPVHTSTSIGIAVADSNHRNAEDLISNAGSAVQQAKKHKNGGYAIFQSDMHESTYTRFILEGEMRKAIDHEEFVLYFQPQFSLSDNTITGCEALVRWNSPTRGRVNPGEFIPIAEENGMILELDEWVINKACDTLVLWKKQGITCKMSFNISSRFFNEADPVKMISDAIHRSGVDPRQLELEITEGAIMSDLDISRRKLDELQSLGIDIAIDDFGTGYSSLAYLKELNIDTLKIDGKFVDDLVGDSDSQAIIRSIINLAKLLDMKIVAECVETLDQVSYLKEQECDVIQGYLVSKPLESEGLMTFFNNTNLTL